MSNSEKFDEICNDGPNHPIRTRAEARDLGLLQYWEGAPCSKGHHATRLTDSGACLACHHLLSSQPDDRPIRQSNRFKAELAKQSKNIVYTLGPKVQQKILSTYADTGDIEKAAKAVNMTVPQLNVAIAKSVTLAVSIAGLEKRLRAAKSNEIELYKPITVIWTDEKRATFIRAYVDTGDIARAREAISCPASEYYKEIERNSEFEAQIAEAKPLAEQALEEKAINMALGGNDKLLTLILKAKKPEYKDKIEIDQITNVNMRVTDDQLNYKIAQLLNKYAVELGTTHSSRKGTIAAAIGRDGETEDEEQVSVRLSGDGSSST